MKDIKQLVQDFNSREIQHAVFRSVMDEVTLQIEYPSGLEFFAVFGPPGAGKTTICQSICSKALEFYSADAPPGPGESQVVLVTAPAAPKGRPDWKELFCRILEELNRPLATAARGTRINPGFGGGDLGTLFGRGSTQGIRRALREAIGYRKVRLILIDEGQHVTKNLSREQVTNEMDNLKNLAAETQCLIGLVGTYELLPLIDANGQLSRRVTPIHCPRYSLESKSMNKHFLHTLAVFVDLMPVNSDSKKLVLENQQFLHMRTLGCVGTLATILGKICWRALRTNAGVVNADIIQKSTLLAGCSRRIEAEIEHGEKKWRTLVSASPELADADCQLEDSEQIAVSKKPKPGRSNPRRDRVGGDRTPEETELG